MCVLACFVCVNRNQNSIMAAAAAILSFTSCESHIMPFGFPGLFF